MVEYVKMSTKELTKKVQGIFVSIKNGRNRLQEFIGNFLLSYNDNKDNTPFNKLFQELSKDTLGLKYRVLIKVWIENVSNYKVKYSKEKDTFGITYKSAEEKELVTNNNFKNTVFWNIETKQKKGEKQEGYKTIEQMKKALEQAIKKALLTEGSTSEMIRTIINGELA